MARGDFFSPGGSSFSTNKSGDDTQVAGFFSKKKEVPTKKFKGIKGITATKDAINSQTYRDMGDESMADEFKKKYNIDPSDYMNLQSKRFVSPSGDEVGQIASATSDLSGLLASKQPLSPIGSADYEKEVEGFIQSFKDDFNYRRNYDVDTGQPLRNFQPDPYRTEKKDYFGEEEMRRDYPYRRQFRYENWDGEKYTPGVPFGQKPKTEEKENILQKVGGFLANVFTGTQPVAAGTLDANQQVGQVSERPKLNYVNPDATSMSLGEMADAFKPKNLFGYKDKFGRFDDPGSPLARDRAETMQRVAQNFSAPITADARTIGQIRADQEARMRENARLRNESFQRGERVQQKSADVTYGTNMLSNPAFGFRDKMTDSAKAQYDKSARDATEMAKTDPSLGNVITSVGNFLKRQVNKITGETALTREKSLEKIGERQLRLANKEINRPTYQKEAYARKMLGITNDQLKARNLQQIRANATARNQAFQAERRAKAVERAAKKYGENKGSGKKGGFGSGTVGKGMPSNPGSQRQTGVGESANNLNRHTVGHSSTQPGSKGSKGGGGTGGGGGGGGTGGGGQSGGSPSGKKGINRSKSRRRCDIRTKIDITSLTNQNLMKDDLAKVAYFVQELKEK